MKKVKEFCKKHKREIIIVGGVATVILLSKHVKHFKSLKREIAFYNSQNRILWKSTGKFIDVDTVKKVVEWNTDIPDALYAIVKEKGEKYALVILNESPVQLALPVNL